MTAKELIEIGIKLMNEGCKEIVSCAGCPHWNDCGEITPDKWSIAREDGTVDEI